MVSCVVLCSCQQGGRHSFQHGTHEEKVVAGVDGKFQFVRNFLSRLDELETRTVSGFCRRLPVFHVVIVLVVIQNVACSIDGGSEVEASGSVSVVTKVKDGGSGLCVVKRQGDAFAGTFCFERLSGTLLIGVDAHALERGVVLDEAEETVGFKDGSGITDKFGLVPCGADGGEFVVHLHQIPRASVFKRTVLDFSEFHREVQGAVDFHFLSRSGDEGGGSSLVAEAFDGVVVGCHGFGGGGQF